VHAVTSKPRPTRLTRQERRRLTREQLLVSAREVFEERGYADSSLEEIAERRFQSHIDQVEAIIREAPAARTALDVGSVFSAYFSRERAWEQLFHEFCSVASRDEAIGDRFRARFREAKDAITRLVDQETKRRGVELPLPTDRFVDGIFALFSGISFEKLIDPERTDDALFGEMLGLIAAGASARTPRP
jgi:hypothetical protein